MDWQDRNNRQSSRRSGQIIIMLTMMLVPMFGLLGLVADVGYMHFVKMSAQTAAEAAAQSTVVHLHVTLGGAGLSCTTSGVTCSSTPANCPANITTPTNSVQVGCMYAQAHGFNSTNQWVTYQAGVNGTPPTASGSGTASYWVTFRVIQKVPQMFSAILGNMSGMVAARSSAAIIGASDCIYALHRGNYYGAVAVGGSASLVSSCGIYVNSSSSDAIAVWGGATLQAPEYDIHGGTTAPLTPAPNTGLAEIDDPLAGLPVPATATYTCDRFNYSSGVANWSNPTLSPGVYCGGLSVDHNVYTFNPGNYIFVGGGLTVGANGGVSGNGVMFYNTFGATTTHGTLAYGPINIGANSGVNLKAPTSGTYAGILIFEDRSAPASSDSYGGGGTAVYQGSIYAKNAAVSMGGNSSINSEYTILVADTISMVGNPSINNNYTSLPSGSPIQKVVVVE